MDEQQPNTTPPTPQSPETLSVSGVNLVPEPLPQLIEPLPQIPTISLWEKIKVFFSSTLGKTITFTALFLGITTYILTSSNSVLFKGSFNSNDLGSFNAADQGGVATSAAEAPVVTDAQREISALPNNMLSDEVVDRNATAAIGNRAKSDATIDTSIVGTNSGRNLATISQQDLINQRTIIPDGVNNTTILPRTDDGAPSPILTPSAPTGLTATCGDKDVTLRWIPVVHGGAPITYKLRVDDLSNGWSKENSILPPNTGDTFINDTPTLYTFPPKLDQEYKWWVSATDGTTESAISNGANFTCKSPITRPTAINPTGLEGSKTVIPPTQTTPPAPTLCGDNEYFVKSGASGTCQKIPAYKGAAGQSDFICGLYKAMIDDAASYKLNELTKKSLQSSLTLQCKVAAVATPPAPTLCGDNEYFAKSGTSGACQKIIVYQGTAGQSDAMCKAYYKNILDGVENKLNETTKKSLATSIAECKAIPAVGQPPVTPPKQLLCPLGTHLPFGLGTIPSDCKLLPSIQGLKGIKVKVVCEDLTKLATQGPLLKMDPATEQQLLKTINGKECNKKIVPKYSGNQNEEKKPPVQEKVKTVYVNQSAKNQAPPIDKSAVASITPLHPVAGANLPSATSETGPAIWIYGIGAALSYFTARKTKKRK